MDTVFLFHRNWILLVMMSLLFVGCNSFSPHCQRVSLTDHANLASMHNIALAAKGQYRSFLRRWSVYDEEVFFSK